MTQPTQAQIEEVLNRAIMVISGFKLRSNGEKVARENLVNQIAALTAAAEVGMYDTIPMKSALTAAAEECPGCKAWANRYAFAKGIYEKELSEAKAKMKERCARRIEAFIISSEGKIRSADDIDDYAAAIRGLGDEG